MAGNNNSVVSSNKDQVIVLMQWLSGSDIEKALAEFTEAELEYDKAKKRLDVAKKEIAKAMRQ